MIIDARYLVDYASDAAFAIDDDLTIVAWNYGARRLLGYVRREVLGRHCSEILQIVSPNGEPLCIPDCEGARCFRHFRAFTALSCRARHKDSSWVPLNIASVVMPKRVRPSQTRSAVAVVILRGEEEEDRSSPPGQELQIFTLGRFGLATGGRSIATNTWERKQAITLLKNLVANLGRPVHRETLIELLWPEIDEDRGWKRLKVTVHSLRRQLRSAGIVEGVVETAGKTYLLRREVVWVDSDAFEKCIGEGAILQRRQQWDKALHHFDEARRLYRGDYMEEDVYADWCTAERERLFEIYLELLTRMAECHTRVGRFAEAVRVCRDALICDPVRESFHRALMEYLVRLGNAEQAMAQYHDCRRLLARELDVEPMPETQRLYQEINEKFRGAAAE